jgi:hypothetical protein
LIDADNATWRNRAKDKTRDLEADASLEVTSIWSPIKPAFMKLQKSKCIFCEKKIEPQAIEQDVEHFRPKNSVKRWRPSRSLVDDEGVVVRQPSSGSEDGYRLLAYNFLNYAAACKTCNSTRKRDYFPISSRRMSHSKNPLRMTSEKPYLLFPIGSSDANPEQLIEFEGFTPQATRTRGFNRQRALVTIELFELDTRKGLLIERAERIEAMYLAFRLLATGNTTDRANSEQAIKRMTKKGFGHTNCLRSFKRLCESDWNGATDVYNKITEYLTSVSET